MTTVVERAWSQVSATDDTVRLIVQHCGQCGQNVFPPTAERCPQCWSPELAAEQASGNGTVYSYTVVRRSFPGREVPYIVGLVDLDMGLRVMATIAAEESDVAVGSRVAAHPGSERLGMPATAYEFRPVD